MTTLSFSRLRSSKRSKKNISTNVARTSADSPVVVPNLLMATRFIVRDFSWNDGASEKEKRELEELGREEKELWTDLLKLSRINFSEAYQILAHLKTVRLFVESVLRYGLPADYAGVIVSPDTKSAPRTLKALSTHFAYLAASSRGPTNKVNKQGAATGAGEDVGGEWATLMEQEYYDFVLFELPKVIL